MESFFSFFLTRGKIEKCIYHTRDKAKVEVFGNIKRFHNPVRRYLTISYLSLVEFVGIVWLP
jgi:putative transposase